MKKTIADVESTLAEALSQPLLQNLPYAVPTGLMPVFYLQAGKDHRKKKWNASAESWNPQGGEILIKFEPLEEEVSGDAHQASVHGIIRQDKPIPGAPAPLADLVRVLHRAENRPGYDFVALKWFRDVALQQDGFEWATSDATRRAVLEDAIKNRLILTHKVPNPKSPQFPVTAIRLNRLTAEVKAVLGEAVGEDTDFHPVEIRGEPLSATVLRERRR